MSVGGDEPVALAGDAPRARADEAGHPHEAVDGDAAVPSVMSSHSERPGVR